MDFNLKFVEEIEEILDAVSLEIGRFVDSIVKIFV